jgi:hypothetical protein
MEEDPKLIPLATLARVLRVPCSWLRQEAEGGTLPHLKAGRALLFDRAAVERVLLERAQRTPGATRA